MPRWALQLSADERALAARLRDLPGVEICAAEEAYWLRGSELNDVVEQTLQQVPGGRRYAVLPDGQLVAHGARIPQGHLPAGDWQPLASFLKLTLPTAHFTAASHDTVSLSLVRDDRQREPNLLVTTLETWSAYAISAPQVRLACWHFAQSADGRVVVRGEPLPPLPGERFVEAQGIATPAGWYWSPPVDAAVLRLRLALQAHDLALLQHDGSLELVSADDFVKASRSAVRHSPEAAGHG